MNSKRLNQLGAAALAGMLANDKIEARVSNGIKQKINLFALIAFSAGVLNLSFSPAAEAGSKESEARRASWGIAAALGLATKSPRAAAAGGAFGEIANAVSNNDNKMWASSVAAILGANAAINIEKADKEQKQFEAWQKQQGASDSGPYSKKEAQMALNNGAEIYYVLNKNVYVGSHNSPSMQLVDGIYKDGSNQATPEIKEAIKKSCSNAFGTYNTFKQSMNSFNVAYNKNSGTIQAMQTGNKYSASYEEYQKRQAYMATVGKQAHGELVSAAKAVEVEYVNYKKDLGLCVRMSDQAIADNFSIKPILEEVAAEEGVKNNLPNNLTAFNLIAKTPDSYGTINTVMKKQTVTYYPKFNK